MKERLEKLKAYLRSERSQGLTEFAIIAPVILLLTFGIIDFGRGLYLYITLQQAANEGARVAVRASYFIDPNGGSHNWPKNSDVQAATQGHAVAVVLANPCPNGPIPAGFSSRTRAPPGTAHRTGRAAAWGPTRRRTWARDATT